jgi:N-methylhydantoinase A
MRYRGQGYEIEVILPDPEGRLTGVAELPALFGQEYARIFSSALLNEPLEIVTLKVEALGPRPSMADGCRLPVVDSVTRLKGSRQVYRPELDDVADCPVYDRYALRPGDEIAGPALIEERESTCVINGGDVIRVDANLNLIADIALAGRN